MLWEEGVLSILRGGVRGEGVLLDLGVLGKADVSLVGRRGCFGRRGVLLV